MYGKDEIMCIYIHIYMYIYIYACMYTYLCIRRFMVEHALRPFLNSLGAAVHGDSYGKENLEGKRQA